MTRKVACSVSVAECDQVRSARARLGDERQRGRVRALEAFHSRVPIGVRMDRAYGEGRQDVLTGVCTYIIHFFFLCVRFGATFYLLHATRVLAFERVTYYRAAAGSAARPPS